MNIRLPSASDLDTKDEPVGSVTTVYLDPAKQRVFALGGDMRPIAARNGHWYSIASYVGGYCGDSVLAAIEAVLPHLSAVASCYTGDGQWSDDFSDADLELRIAFDNQTLQTYQDASDYFRTDFLIWEELAAMYKNTPRAVVGNRELVVNDIVAKLEEAAAREGDRVQGIENHVNELVDDYLDYPWSFV